MSSVSLLRALPLEQLRQRTSAKWRSYPADVLPLFVAEMDFALAPHIVHALQSAVELGDTGYVADLNPMKDAFAGFAQRRFSWSPEPARMRSTTDVALGIVEILRRVTKPGERVIIMPPVYPPFYDLVTEAGAVVEQVPLFDSGTDWELDLAGVEAALAAGARAILLCNPHNPTGTVHSADTLANLAKLAKTYGAAVVSDEIHAPLTQQGITFTPFLQASSEASEVGYAVVSASKTFNLAGLKAAIMVTASDGPTKVLESMPPEVQWRTAQFGMLAATAAYAPESDTWLESLLATLDENRRLVASLLAQSLPEARFRVPQSTYLAWIDLSAYNWGEDPSKKILRESKVALNPGPTFGSQGAGHVRLNFGTSPEILTDAISRIAALVHA
jgi:cystathionine beta-lyase